MSYSPFELKELRYLDRSATCNTAFTSGSDSAWTNAVKLRAFDVKVTTPYSAIKSKEIQTSLHGQPPSIPMHRGGGSIEFSVFLEGGGAATPCTMATLLSTVMGGIKNPAAASATPTAGSTTSVINVNSHGKVVGEGVLLGTRGDGYGGGSAAMISYINSAAAFTIQQATPGAVQTTAAEVGYGQAVYLDGTAERYCDFLLIGHYPGSGATDDPDQINFIGCSGSVTFSMMKPGEAPIATFKFQATDWRNESNATKATISHLVAASGDNPAGNLAIGAILLGDLSAYTRVSLAGGNVEINPNITIQQIVNPAGVNGGGGWVTVPSDVGPTCSITRYWGDMPGLYDDFVNQTAKTVLFQWGHEKGNTIAMVLQKAYVDAVPERVEFAKQMGAKVNLHGTTPGSTDLSDANDKLADSPMIVYFL